MAEASPHDAAPVAFDCEPARYRHWKLEITPPLARLVMKVDEAHPLRPGYVLKLNSYDLAVDIELADAVERLRFEHPEVKAVIVTSGTTNCFCAGANIYMLGSSTHGFKVNFCKYTNETRLALEEACSKSDQHYVAALNGVASGGGYELALACEQILLQDDGSSAVSFPETPLLAVLPGTGGLTRLVDKRKVRRDLADVFSTLAEGVRGKRAKDWALVDDIVPRSKFDELVRERAMSLASRSKDKTGAGIALGPLTPAVEEEGGLRRLRFEHVTLTVDRSTRSATLEVRAPREPAPASGDDLRARPGARWALDAYRQIDRALLELRFNEPNVGLLLVKSSGDGELVLAHDKALLDLAAGDWLAREMVLHMARVLRRLDNTAKSIFAIVEPKSAFRGSLLELTLAADRTYMLDGEPEDGEPARIALGPMSFGALTMYNGLTRLATRFLGRPERVPELEKHVAEALDAAQALELGLVTFTPDDIDWEDDVRIAIEERLSLSPDALTAMESNLRFAGPETMETKIFARLSAWQNWIFQRPNAVGERGALTMYGRPERPEFDWRRT
jgi:benzoyl-CoA-dihydrodiol lyase